MRTLLLRINGMACQCGIDHISRSLTLVPGVHIREVDTLFRTVCVDHDENASSIDQLVGAVRKSGYQVDECHVIERQPCQA